MKAFAINQYGGNDVVRFAEAPDPEPAENEILVEVHAASINPLDLKIRDGKLKLILPYRLPLILGNDMAGIVVKVGSKVKRFKPGDEVYSRPNQDKIGTFAELISVNEEDAALKPKTLSMPEAAAVPLVGLTAWQALVEKGELKAGQKVLIHAGSGGLGTVAIQLAKHLGAVIATTTGTTNVAWVKSLGADTVIDYKKDAFETILKDYDLVLDTQGGETLKKSIKVLRPGGRIISVAGPPDPDFAKESGFPLFLKLAFWLISFKIRSQSKRRGVNYSFLWMKANGSQLHQLASLIDSGKIRPTIDKVFPFESTVEALQYVEKGRAKGKVVIDVSTAH